jgi:hypothetical protein
MKLSIKIETLLEGYENSNCRFICYHIRENVLNDPDMSIGNCGDAILELFKKYFQLAPKSCDIASIPAWFLHNDVDFSRMHIKLIDGTTINTPWAFRTKQELRIFMMREILKQNPDEVLEFETEDNSTYVF